MNRTGPMTEPNNIAAPAAEQVSGSQTYCTFRLRDTLFGTPTGAVKEVTALPPLTPIPHAPAAVCGYVNLRGHIVLVLDLNRLLQRPPTAVDAESRLIVLQPELGEAFGLLAERIGEIASLSAAQIETHRANQVAGGPELTARPEEELICGVGKLDGELLMILDASRLLPWLEQTMTPRGAKAARAPLATASCQETSP